MALYQDREEDLESQLNRGALWAVVYGDLMSYLMIFFLILFVFTASRSLRMQFSMHSVEQEFGKEDVADMQVIFSQHGIQKIANVDVDENRMRITFLEPVLFGVGSADLKATSIPHLKKLSGVVQAIPNAVQIEGHTDDLPMAFGSRYPSNWELSAARAFSVLRFFILQGIPPARLSALGYGEHMPAVRNDTPEGRAKNRRIEINILRQKA